MKVRGDLHIHTCLSPCGDNGMVPNLIIEKALLKGINMIAICDHNSTENTGACIEASKGRGITVIPGMEAASKEEAHILALFSDLESAKKMQDYIWENLEGKNNEEIFGAQLIADRKGKITGQNDKFLLGTTSIPVNTLVSKIKSFGGLAIASHIDRESFGIIGQLGFIPEDLDLDALEISSRITLNEAKIKFKQYSKYSFIRSSDAHFPEDVGKVFTEFELESNSFDSLKKYLLGKKALIN